MSEIIPRWEWRVFGEHFDDVASALAGPIYHRVKESDEIYLLSVGGTDVVKVRDALMDVKQLLRVNEDGLEQWLPVMKTAFPLSAADVGAVFLALRVDAPSSLARASYTLRELLDEVVRPSSELLVVEVHKTRQRYKLDGCMAELTDVRTPQGSTRTIAVESENAADVMATLAALRLAPKPNVNFARGLRSLVRFGTERYAVIDVGTNSVKFHIGERDRYGTWHTVADRAETTRLGDGLQETGQLNREPIERTVEAIAAMAQEAREQGVEAIAAVGTAGLRIASNSADFLAAVRARAGVAIEVISGEEESRLAYLGAMAGIGRSAGSRVVFDTGGGSSQFTFGVGDEVGDRFSVNVGAVRYTERYGLAGVVSPEVLAKAFGELEADLERLDGRPVPDSVVALGGAVTNLAAVKHGLATYDPDVVQGTVLDRSEIDRQIEIYRTRTAEERRTVVGLQPQRADIILAGACIVRTVLRKLGKDSLTVSDRGLRHGVLMERFG